MFRKKYAVRRGDTFVTLECDSNLSLESRVDLLAFAFAKIVQGSVLRKVVKWDLLGGCVQFIVGGGSMNAWEHNSPGPRGLVVAKLEDVPPAMTVKTRRI